MRRIRVLPVIALCCAVWWACTEGGDPTATGRSVPVGIVPRFQIDPALFATSPIDRIRLQARDAATRVVVGATDRSVDPNATQWSLSLGIDLGGQETRVVIVEAELFSGSSVVWSGRLGPFTAPSAAPALALDIYPGPLDNLDVLSLNVLGAQSQLVAGTSVTLTAELTLVTGSDASPVVQWASTNPTVATVTPAGSTVTLTALTAGTANIVASVGTQDFEFALEVLPVGAATKTWLGGAAAGATSWSVAENWSPTGVPTASDIVLIPATANGPLLSSAAQVAGLTVSGGATLDLGDFSMQVGGDIRVLGAVTGGTVVAGGTGGLLDGTLDGLFISQSRLVTGALTVAGNLEIAAPLTVGTQSVSVGGSLTVLTGGRLVMTSTGGVVSVAGDAIFAGASEEGFLTAGLLLVRGNFTAAGSTPTAFAASGTHAVGLGGSGLQTIGFEQPGPTASRFNTLYVDNGDAVDIVSSIYAAGNVIVTSKLIVPSPLSFDIGGVLTLEFGSTLDVDGSVTASSCVNQGGTVTGTGATPCAGGPAATRTFVGGATGDVGNWQNANNWSPPGVPGPSDTVLVQGASYNPVMTADAQVAGITVGGGSGVLMSGYTLTVTGDVSSTGGSFLDGVVDVTGPGNVLEGLFTTLRVSAPRALSGEVDANLGLELLDTLDTNGQQVYVLTDLTVSGAGTLLMTSPAAFVWVGNDATFNGGDHTGALTAGELALLGDLYATDVSPTSFVSSGTHLVSLVGGAEQTVTFDVPGPSQQRLNDVFLTYLTRGVFANGGYAAGDFSVAGHLVVPLSTTLTVGGAMDLSDGSVLQVDGTLSVSPCNDLGAVIIGSGTQPCGVATVVDRTWVGGFVGAEQSWTEPGNWTPAGVPLSNEIVFIPSATWQPTLTDNASVGGLIVHLNGVLDLAGYPLTVAGDLVTRGSLYNGLVQVTGPGNLLEGYVDDVQILAPRTLSGWLYAAGNVDVQAKLTVAGPGLYVGGDLSTSGSGELSMSDPNSYIQVVGNADLAGLRTDLTSGALYAYGDLTVSTLWSAGAAVYIGGNVDQAVSLSDPGLGTDQQYFTSLYVSSSGPRVVTFTGPVYVTDSFFTSGGTITGTGFLEARGTFYGSATTFSGLPVRIDTSVPPGSHVLSSLTFTGYATNVTQLFIRMPGSTTAQTLTSPVFNTVPQAGFGYYIEADNTIVGGATLTIQLNGPTPPTVLAQYYKTDTDSQVIWGP